MAKILLNPNTILYPVPVVLVSSGIEPPNIMTCNRISSCSAEPPRLCVSIRPSRHTHSIIKETGEFVVSLPYPGQSTLTDYLGVVTGSEEDKALIANLQLSHSQIVQTPLLEDFPVNIECVVDKAVDLDSHTLFIGLVQAVHVDEALLTERGDIDVMQAKGVTYARGTVREKPTYKFKVEELRNAVIERGD